MRVEKELSVNAPVDRVYQLWTDFENFPRFMKHVVSVTKTGGETYHWKARLGGREVEWDAKIVGQVPNRSVTWRSTSGAENAGAVNLAEQGNVTLLQVVIEYHASWFAGLVATVTGEMARSVEADLERFKQLAEGVATGGAGHNAAKGAPDDTATTDPQRSATAQGTTSQSVGPGNTGAHGPSSARAGWTKEDGASQAGAANAAGAESQDGGTGSTAGAGSQASGSDDQSWVINDRGSNDAVAVSAGTVAPSSSGTSSADSSMSSGGSSTGSSMSSGGSSTSMDFSTRSGERVHGAGAPPVDETADNTSQAMDSGSPAGLDSTSGGGNLSGASSGTPGAAAGATGTGGVSPEAAEAGGALGPSLYSNEAAGLTSPGEPVTGTLGDQTGTGGTAAASSGGSSGAGAADSAATAGTRTGTSSGSGGTGAITGDVTIAPTDIAAGAARPIDVERGTAGRTGGTGGWGSPTGGNVEAGGAGLTGSGGAGLTGSGAGAALGDLEQGSGVGGGATGDPGAGLGLPAVATPDLDTGQMPGGSTPAMGPTSGGTGSTSTSGPGAMGA